MTWSERELKFIDGYKDKVESSLNSEDDFRKLLSEMGRYLLDSEQIDRMLVLIAHLTGKRLILEYKRSGGWEFTTGELRFESFILNSSSSEYSLQKRLEELSIPKEIIQNILSEVEEVYP